MIDQSLAIEIGKIVAPLLVTAGIAWFTVTAALRRFKIERRWERRVDAYANLMTALRRLQLVLGRWQDGMERHRGLEDERARKAFDDAHHAFEHAHGIAELLLSSEVLAQLRNLSIALDKIQGHVPWAEVNKAYGINEEVLISLRAAGRTSLD